MPCFSKVLAFALFAALAVSASGFLLDDESTVAMSAATRYDASIDSFRSWARKYGKEYSQDEEAHRYGVWQASLKFVNEHNEEAAAGKSTFTVAMNRFADMTSEEFRSMFLRPRANVMRSRFHADPIYTYSPTGEDIPGNWSWVPKGVVTDIKNQGQCGSCWAFSAVAAMEGAYNLKHKGSISSPCSSTCGPDKNPCCSFSEQQVVDCTLNGADNCNVGGEMHDGILYVVSQHKVNTESQYPYTSGNSGHTTECRPQPDPVAVSFTGYANVTQGSDQALTEAAYKFPIISVGIDASALAFQFYSGGIYYHKNCKKAWDELDHGVAVVGYGTGVPNAPGQEIPGDGANDKYYLVKNSWGADWGLNGYIAMARDRDNACGIATDATYVLF